MKLNNVWGYGQLFGFSALDGVNRFNNDFVGTLTQKKIGIRFELTEWVKVFFPVKGKVTFNAITGDMIDAQTKDGQVFITFADCDTIVGYSPVVPEIITQKKWNYKKSIGVEVWFNSSDAITRLVREENGLYKFAICHSEAAYSLARAKAKEMIDCDVQALKNARYDYFAKLPKCKNKKYERLYYKALSVNKVNVRTAEGNIPCTWTTPDRVPHKRMWLWDSVFHALAIVKYNPELAKNAIRAVIAQRRKDGFIPAMMNPYSRGDLTQPQVLSWGVWEVYNETGDIEFLKENVSALEGYLTWDINNRDNNGNGLLEWFTEPEYTESKCGESGIDNSPKFEFDEEMDSVDFSSFLAHDADYLAKIYNELGDEKNAEKWQSVSDGIKQKINQLLWCEEDGVYYDRLLSGKFTKVLTPTSFLPLFAGVPTKEQAQKMVKTLTDENLLWTPVPLATVSKNHPMYSTDMWRGGVWLNFNYFIIKGLMNYGFSDVAEELKNKTLETIYKWYKKTGAIFEFYDPEDKVYPYQCERKG
ncbi:MAG: hypothetical protein IJV99_04180, partial [Clostridia bacterium]|nr:hypothetical protein [Clostridia bacterium]